MWKTVVWACCWSGVSVGMAVTALPHSHDWGDAGFVVLTGYLAFLEWSELARRRSADRQRQ